MKEPNKALKITKITLNVIFYTIIALLLIYSIIIISSRGDNNIPNVFGNGFLAVETDSMVGDNNDSFNPGDLIFVKILSDSQKENLKVGDIITFKDPALQRRLNTHRIVDVRANGLIQTQGDKYDEPDFYLLEHSDIVAKYTGKIGGLGKFSLFLETQLGFGLVIILPIFLMLIYQGYILFSNIFEIKKEKAKEELTLEKEKMRQELLEELAKEELKKDKKE
ncbi:MAG: signal peptidase I [Acholeplasmataceae bacterium]